MQIQIKNIWKIKEATINLDWLSIIAWNNDTWKSTIGKVVFSVIKAFKDYENFSNISKSRQIRKNIEELYLNIRKVFHILRENKDKEAWIKYKELRQEFDNFHFYENFIHSNKKEEFLNKKINIINGLNIENEEKNKIVEKIKNIGKVYFKKEEKKHLINSALYEIFMSEFNWKINFWKEEWIIIFKDFELELFSVFIKDWNINLNIKDDILKIKDSTFVNSPIILDFFNDSKFIDLQYHYEDLFKKINNIEPNNKKRKNGFWKEIKKTIKWSFELRDDFIWIKLSFSKELLEENIEVINTATWIKSFWILDLLDKSDNLDWDDLLILDEPEVHLHPQWQVKYAELIVYLIKKRDMSVLITSHSPYIIEALSKYSKKEDIKASFYLAEENEKWKVNIEDKTEKKYEIFKKLSKPFRDLMLK